MKRAVWIAIVALIGVCLSASCFAQAPAKDYTPIRAAIAALNAAIDASEVAVAEVSQAQAVADIKAEQVVAIEAQLAAAKAEKDAAVAVVAEKAVVASEKDAAVVTALNALLALVNPPAPVEPEPVPTN